MATYASDLGEIAEAFKQMKADLDNNPETQALGLLDTITAFRALPAPVTEADIKRNTWTIHLQYPTSFFESRNEEDLEITVLRPGMIDPATFPCKRSLLEQSSSLPYLLSVILKACTEGSDQLVELDLENYELNMPADIGKGAATHTVPATPGMLPGSRAIFKKKSPDNLPTNLHLSRPAKLYVRDAAIIHILAIHMSLHQFHDLKVLPHNDLRTGYADETGIGYRRDVTFCSNEGCVSLSTLHARCSRCQITYYCSGEHQKEHWPVHKNMCKMFKRLGDDASRERIKGKLNPVSMGGYAVISL